MSHLGVYLSFAPYIYSIMNHMNFTFIKFIASITSFSFPWPPLWFRPSLVWIWAITIHFSLAFLSLDTALSNTTTSSARRTFYLCSLSKDDLMIPYCWVNKAHFPHIFKKGFLKISLISSNKPRDYDQDPSPLRVPASQFENERLKLFPFWLTIRWFYALIVHSVTRVLHIKQLQCLAILTALATPKGS